MTAARFNSSYIQLPVGPRKEQQFEDFQSPSPLIEIILMSLNVCLSLVAEDSVRHFVKKVRLAFGKLRSLPWSGIATEMRVDIGHAHLCTLQ